MFGSDRTGSAPGFFSLSIPYFPLSKAELGVRGAREYLNVHDVCVSIAGPDADVVIISRNIETSDKKNQQPLEPHINSWQEQEKQNPKPKHLRIMNDHF